MKDIFFRWVVRHFLADFTVSSRRLSDGERAQALVDLSSQSIEKYLNIMIANLIRRHLYVKNMVEGAWYLGAISVLRKLQAESKQYVESIESDKLTQKDQSVPL